MRKSKVFQKLQVHAFLASIFQTVPDKDGKGGNVVGGNKPQKYKPVYIKHGPVSCFKTHHFVTFLCPLFK